MKMTMAVNKKKSYTSEKKHIELQSYLCIMLPIIGLVILTAYPLFWAFNKSFYFYDGTPSSTAFVGLRNYITAFKDLGYWKTWITTFEIALIKVPVELFVALIIACVFNSKIRGRTIYRAVYFSPQLVSAVVIGIMFSSLFSYFGILNAWLVEAGILKEAVDWYANRPTAIFIIIASSMWHSIGLNILYFLSALQNIPSDVYEAADIDGAGVVRKFFKITIPMIAPIFQTILLLSINGTLQTNALILTTTNGGPSGSTHTVMSYMAKTYLPGFADINVNLGYGAAQSVITSICFCIVAIVYSKLSKKLENVY